MLPIRIQEVAEAMQGTLVSGPSDSVATGLVVDSQRVKPGDLFVAFVGKSQNGHRFIPDAIARGAVGVVVTEPVEVDSDVGMIHVDNPLQAVQRLAMADRAGFMGPVIGVTGSNGKTTTKEMIATVFQVGGPCLFTEANLNTELGLPLTLLRREIQHKTIVLEMGMRGLGQIDELCTIAAPSSGIITNIGQSHLELLGSQENIAKAKSELIEHLPSTGFAALPIADPWMHRVVGRTQANVLWYGIDDEPLPDGAPGSITRCFAWASDVRTIDNGMSFTAHVNDVSIEVRLNTWGRHNVRNALGAIALGAAHSLPLSAMVSRLNELAASRGRLHVISGAREVTVIDDCYNASPLSMRASLEVLSDLSKSTSSVAILGDMYELGDFAEAGHREVGQSVAEHGIERLVAIGPMARWIAEEASQRGVKSFTAATREEAAARLRDWVPDGATVLIKASRGMGLETIVTALQS